MDAGLFMGRSFRVGWGPGWTLAHCAQQISAPHSKEPTLKGHNADFSFMPQTVRSKTYACTRAHIQHCVSLEHRGMAANGMFREPPPRITYGNPPIRLLKCLY